MKINELITTSFGFNQPYRHLLSKISALDTKSEPKADKTYNYPGIMIGGTIKLKFDAIKQYIDTNEDKTWLFNKSKNMIIGKLPDNIKDEIRKTSVWQTIVVEIWNNAVKLYNTDPEERKKMSGLITGMPSDGMTPKVRKAIQSIAAIANDHGYDLKGRKIR